MTDKEEIKFAIRYLKKGLKSKRTPPLYEELMKELGFVKKDKVNNLSSVAEVRLANWQKYEKENAELKAENEELKKGLGCETCQIHLEYMSLNNRIDDLERENKELKAGRDINVFTKQLTKAKDIIRNLLRATYGEGWNYSLQVKVEAEKFLKECE